MPALLDEILSFLSEISDSKPLVTSVFLYVTIIITAPIILCRLKPVFDYLHMYTIASKIRKTKEFFTSQQSLDAQTQWIESINQFTLDKYHDLQHTEYATSQIMFRVKPSEQSMDKLDPGFWKQQLANVTKNMHYKQQLVYKQHLRKPKGSRIREYEVSTRRRAERLEENPVKFLSQQHRVKDCELSGGCCGRVCGCCLRPRSMLTNGEIFYSHCTAFCGCCMLFRKSEVTNEVVNLEGLKCTVKGAKVLD